MQRPPAPIPIPETTPVVRFPGAQKSGIRFVWHHEAAYRRAGLLINSSITSICVSQRHPPHHHFCYRASCSSLVRPQARAESCKTGVIPPCQLQPPSTHNAAVLLRGAWWPSQLIEGNLGPPKGPKAVVLPASSGEQHISVSARLEQLFGGARSSPVMPDLSPSLDPAVSLCWVSDHCLD